MQAQCPAQPPSRVCVIQSSAGLGQQNTQTQWSIFSISEDSFQCEQQSISSNNINNTTCDSFQFHYSKITKPYFWGNMKMNALLLNIYQEFKKNCERFIWFFLKYVLLTWLIALFIKDFLRTVTFLTSIFLKNPAVL